MTSASLSQQSHGSHIQNQGIHHLITWGQGKCNEGSSCQDTLIAYVPGCTETAGANKFCQHGSTPNKASLTSPPNLTKGNIQASSQSFQTATVYLRCARSSAFGTHLHAAVKVDTLAPSPGNCTSRCLKRRL